MKKQDTFHTQYEQVAWEMFRQTGNPYLAQEWMKERRECMLAKEERTH